ncbi:DUF1232 domain-containing protein [Aquibacillus koreensis]|uniref:DUF1232 domain-containing protein n=2 Tax=Aquibacillus koreensis TaxID=279446 RepID=A0A9X3WR60_9BACI|nr:DUF1232 domain-containing protein [Aquibacillus koreensis]MCT2534930.1 DUF1232 domain-containing protein [Aquibacillus koreensis]MDC3422176.1 DUF1232 domain-containing protein [Aquibacillus koreensis]
MRFWRRIKFLFNFRKSIPFLKDFFISKEVNPSTKVISILLIIGYIVFPFDVIPDFLVALGIVDDIALASLVLQQMIKMAPVSLKVKHGLIKEINEVHR